MARPRSHAGVGFPSTNFVMDPTPEQLRQDLLLLEHKMGDYRKPLQFSKLLIIGSVTKAFTTETDPVDGKKWPELSERAESVARYGKLRRVKTSARMYRIVTNPQNWGVTKEGVFLNASRMPEYFVYHQQDDRKTSGGTDVLKLTKPQIAKLQATIQSRTKQLLQGSRMYEGLPPAAREASMRAHVARQESGKLRKEAGLGSEYVGAGTGAGEIPQRRFIGVDGATVEEIRRVMDKWARDVIIIYKRGGTKSVNLTMAHRPGMK